MSRKGKTLTFCRSRVRPSRRALLGLSDPGWISTTATRPPSSAEPSHRHLQQCGYNRTPMKPFETLDSIITPDGRKLTLHRRDQVLAIYLEGDELMATRAHSSEVALATLALEGLTNTHDPRVLIGGLGLGYTLRSALAVLPPKAKVIVAEIFEIVETWGRTHLSELHGTSLDDSRVQIVHQDVHAVIAQGNRPWEAILLDVDNGPAAWCLGSNARLYDRKGLEGIKRALSPGGMLAVWSASHDATFVKRLRKSGFDTRTEAVRAHGQKGSRHTIFLARSPGRR